MSKKDEFVGLYKVKTGSDPSVIDRKDPKQIKKFVQNLKKHGMTEKFREAVQEAESDNMMGISQLFDGLG